MSTSQNTIDQNIRNTSITQNRNKNRVKLSLGNRLIQNQSSSSSIKGSKGAHFSSIYFWAP